MLFDWMKHKHRGLRIYVLYVLESSPKNGAEIIDTMETMSRGLWRPSPGSVYPLLETLAEEKSIKKRDDGKYELTQQGKEELSWPHRMRVTSPRSADEVLNEMISYVSYLEDLAKNSKLAPYSQKIKELQTRIAKLETDENASTEPQK